eukprot:Clim_evm88s152 gene=Clim_evmTU88s152
MPSVVVAQLVEEGNRHPEKVPNLFPQLQKAVLHGHLSQFSFQDPQTELNEQSLRGRVWKIFLRVWDVNAEEYLHFVQLGSSPVWSNINNDAKRTFKNNEQFMQQVGIERLERFLNAFAHFAATPAWNHTHISYSQGMNTLAGVLLSVMPELDAFYAMVNLVLKDTPRYHMKAGDPALPGAHDGVKLVSEIVLREDKELADYLSFKGADASVWAFPVLLSFFASVEPLTEVIHLWDFLIAYGMHFVPVCVVAHVIDHRSLLLKEDKPYKLLRTMPRLNATRVIRGAVDIAGRLPPELYSRLHSHPRLDS